MMSIHPENRSIAVGGGLSAVSEAAAWQSLGPVLAAADELASFAIQDAGLRKDDFQDRTKAQTIFRQHFRM